MTKTALPLVHILDDNIEVRDVLTAVLQASNHLALLAVDLPSSCRSSIIRSRAR